MLCSVSAGSKGGKTMDIAAPTGNIATVSFNVSKPRVLEKTAQPGAVHADHGSL